ncbi:MAG: oxidative damage protection protein [Deltaproteobacteria bacterium]|nr:oxidative damage protection protein [Deltaproteobacteria bacterium]
MNEPRMVFCKKLEKEAPGLPFKPFTDDFGQQVYDHVSMEAWQMWLRESPRYVNTYGLDLQSDKGRQFLRDQMKVFFNFEEGNLADTAWVPPESSGAGESEPPTS